MEDNSTKRNLIAELEELQKQAKEIEAKKIQENNHLSTIKHPQKDFFIADIFDSVSFQSDIASMEHPLFALKAGDTKDRHYEHNGFTINIRPTSMGIATIHDKDIWIYCISKLMQAKYEGQEISKTVHFTIYDYLITTNRDIGGKQYELTKNALDRLSSTRITTNIETTKTNEARGFGLIDSWRIVEEKDGRMVRVSVTLPEWLYKSVSSNNVLTISPDYFRLRKPLDRRIYELTRKHCGNQAEWKISLDLLHKKTGSTGTLRKFRLNIKSLAETDELPDYKISYDVKSDILTFKRR